MCENRAIAAFTFWKSANKLQDTLPKINRQRQNSAELDDDRVHLPETILEIDVQERFADAQMCGRAYREKLGQPFDDAEKD